MESEDNLIANCDAFYVDRAIQGTYQDLLTGQEGQYRIKLLHTHKTTEYPSLEILPDGTFIATNAVAYVPGEDHSVVSIRFNLKELDVSVRSVKQP